MFRLMPRLSELPFSQLVIPSRGKPNTRVTSRKVEHCFGRNLVTGRIPSARRSLAISLFPLGDTKSSHFRCGNRPMPTQLWPPGRLSSFLRNRDLPNPLAAAPYFAADDTSVGFTPSSVNEQLLGLMPSPRVFA